MNALDDAVLLRAYVGETDVWEGRSLYRAIVEEARRLNLAGATVLRGMMGYGGRSRIHTARFLRLSDDLPVVVEIVDARDRVELLLPFLKKAVRQGLVTLEKVEIVHYGSPES